MDKMRTYWKSGFRWLLPACWLGQVGSCAPDAATIEVFIQDFAREILAAWLT